MNTAARLYPFLLSVLLTGLPLDHAVADTKVRLSLLKNDASDSDVANFLSMTPAGPPESATGYSAEREAAIRTVCSATGGGEDVESIGAILLSLFVEPAINYISKSISKKLEREAEKYTGGYSASISAPLYGDVSESRSLRWSCLRATRVADGELTFDFVAQMRLSPGGEAIQFRPLRLYYADKAIAAAVNNSVGVAANIAITSVYLEGPQPKETKAFEHTLFSSKRIVPYKDERALRRQLRDLGKARGEKVSADSLSLFDYMGFASGTNLAPWSDYTALPLPRWSIDTKKQPTGTGMANITFTVAEAGQKSDILKFAEWYWSETQDDWSKLLKEAAKKVLADDG